uniref:Uncharacterized protein AlNc14C273G9994 n=1 Tax=Albugo laibachii Nc14 TaxID=890382 RepID=F0WUI3_9STRA|nr:conserved hypothetical protein [Albugo laibachii Nc14]|eukprot:CCA25064.1 conserved hypothetical protein [Albugo laibachii Nc14]
MSEVEEALDQIRNFKGVEGYVIADSSGNVLRRHPQMQAAEAEKYAVYMKELAVKAHGVVRDINPEVLSAASRRKIRFEIIEFVELVTIYANSTT